MVRFATAIVFSLAVLSLGNTAAAANSGEIVLLDFWSPQCGPCMSMKPTMHAFEQANYPIQEVDTTRDSETSRRFGVTQIPCFIMLVDGHEVEREVGAISSKRLQDMFEHAKDVVVQQRRLRGQSQDNMQPGSAVARQAQATVAGPAPQLSATPVANSAAWPPSATAASTGATLTPTAAVVRSQPATQAAPANTGDFPTNLMAATVRIRVDDSQGRSFGTGTIIDSRKGEALIVTCGHLFRESKGKGPMTVELFDVSSGTPRVAEQLAGQLISYDLTRDVAFVSVRPTRQVSAAAVAPPRTPIQRGDRVATIGCSNGADPTLLPQRINQLDRYQGPANIEVSGAPEEGRSGGGLFNLQGQLIGVCYAADYEGKEGLYAALDSIHEELNRLNLQDVYAKSGGTGPNLATAPANQDLLVRGQEPRASQPPITPIGSPALSGISTPSNTIPQNLTEKDRAALTEIARRAATSEVVVIVRPKAPGGQSEVIQLDDVSPEFIKALESQRHGADAPLTR